MSELNYWLRRPLGRRSMIRGAGLGVAGLTGAALIGCGDSDDAAPTTAPGGATTPVPATEVPADQIVRGGTMTIHLGYDHTGLDPATSRGGNDHHWLYSIFDCLVNNGPDFSTQPGIAESWEVQDDLTLVFNLRQGVKFHDGSDLTAEDVRFTIERHQNPETQSYAAGQVTDIESVEVLDEHTVRFALNSPTASIFAILGDRPGMIMPQAALERMGGDAFNTGPIGSGPFRHTRHVVDASNEMERFTDYWIPEYPYIDKIVSEVVPNSSVQFANLRTGRSDIVQIATQDRTEARRSSEFEYHEWTGTGYTQVNTNLAVYPNTDKRVRQAMSFALNRQAILSAVYFDEGELANGPITRASWAFDESIEPVQEDLQRARDLLAAAGYPDGIDFSMVMAASEVNTPLSELLQEQLARVGLRMALDVRTSVEAGTSFRNQEHAIFLIGFSGRADPDPTMFENFHSKGGFNRVIYNDAYEPDEDQLALDALIEQGRRVYDLEERKEIYSQAVRRMIDDAAGLFFTHNTNAVGLSNRVRGFSPYGDGKFRLHEMWLDG